MAAMNIDEEGKRKLKKKAISLMDKDVNWKEKRRRT